MALINEIKTTTAADLLFLNAVHEKSHVRAEYVGCVTNEYLLFRFPKVAKNPRDLHALKAGQQLTVRVIINQESLDYLIFTASIQSITNLKVPLIVLNYPKDVQVKQLRSEPRLPVELMANIEDLGSNQKLLALITDISLSGFKCECLPLDETEEDIMDELKESIAGSNVSLLLPSDIEHNQTVDISGLVKNVSLKEKLHLGIQFNDECRKNVVDVYTKLLMEANGVDL